MKRMHDKRQRVLDKRRRFVSELTGVFIARSCAGNLSEIGWQYPGTDGRMDRDVGE